MTKTCSPMDDNCQCAVKEGIAEVYLGLGSNLGDRRANIDNAISLLDNTEGISVEKVSDVIETEPWGFESEDRFLNCAVRCVVERETVSPARLLEICKDIEGQLGRRESIEYDAKGERIYHSRTMDIDILLYDSLVVDEKTLKIPHPLMSERDFVMVPLRRIVSGRIRSKFKGLL